MRTVIWGHLVLDFRLERTPRSVQGTVTRDEGTYDPPVTISDGYFSSLDRNQLRLFS